MNNEKIEKLAKEIRTKPDVINKDQILADAANALDRFVAAKALKTRMSLWRIIMNSRITKLAAAAVIIIAVIIGLNLVGGKAGSNLALADVIKHIQGSSYTFDLTVVTENQGSAPFIIHASVLEPGKMRLDAPSGAGDMSSIIDTTTGQSLLLFHRNKAGQIMTNPVPNLNAGVGGILILCTRSIENLWNLRDGTEKKLGKKEVDGRPAEGFKVSSWDQYFNYEYTIWAHTETAEPILVEVVMTPLQESSEKIIWTMNNFDLHVELDESLFSLEVPQGYTLAGQKDLKELNERGDASTGAELITKALSLWSEGNKEQALQILMEIDWDTPIKFGGDDYLFTMTEQQYISLKPDDQQKVMKEVMDSSSEIRQISKELVSRAQQAVTNQDKIQAERYLQAGLQLGNLLTRDPDSMLIVRLVGIAIQRLILPEMIDLYIKTGEQQKVQAAQKQLQQAEAEIERIKRNVKGN